MRPPDNRPPESLGPLPSGEHAPGIRPAWSVMIPAYRPREDFLRQALESVLAQAGDTATMQIAVIDDASPATDVAQMVQRIAGGRVAVHRNPANLGLAGCWNECVRRSRGQWVHLLHQDDLVLPGFYAALEQGFKGDNPAGAAFVRHAYFDENGHWQSISDLEAPAPGVLPGWLARLTDWNRMQCPAVAVRRDAYEELGLFRTDLPHALDWEMWIRIASRYPVYYDPRILACYRSHPLATTIRQERAGQTIADTFRAITVWSRHFADDPQGPSLVRQARRHAAEKGLKLARRFARERDFSAAGLNLRVVLAHGRQIPVLYRALKVLLRLAWEKARDVAKSPAAAP